MATVAQIFFIVQRPYVELFRDNIDHIWSMLWLSNISNKYGVAATNEAHFSFLLRLIIGSLFSGADRW